MNWATFYLICFAVGFALSLVSLFGGMGHHHFSGKWHLPHWSHGGLHHGGPVHVPAHVGGLSHGGVGHGVQAGHTGLAGTHGGAAKAATHVSPFDFSTMMAFFAWFGGTGYLLTRYSSIWTVLAFGIAIVGGIVGASIIFWFLVKVLLAHETVLDPSDFDMVGVLGKVSSTIRPGGTGEIIFSQAGLRRSSGARSENGLAIPKGSEVAVTRYEKGIAYVRRWEEIASGDFGEAQPERANTANNG